MTQLLRTHVNADTPPGLAERPPLLWGLSSGVHSGLLSLQDENWDATYWSELANELLQESDAEGRRESLANEMRCDAGRILIQRLGQPDAGRDAIEASASKVGKILLDALPDDQDNITSQLERLKREANDESLAPSRRTAALIELGMQCLYALDNPTRALAALDAALDLTPEHPVATVLAADLSLIYATPVQAGARVRRRRDAATTKGIVTASFLDLAEVSDDPSHRLEHLRAAHRALPSDETALRRLIRATSATEGGQALSDLYVKLAERTQDPISKATAIHLAFLNGLDGPKPPLTLINRIFQESADASQTENHWLGPMTEVAMYMERELTVGTAAQELFAVPLLDAAVEVIEDPREVAVLIKHAWIQRLRADVLTSAPEATRAELSSRLERELRFCILHFPEDNWAREQLERLYRDAGDFPALVALLEEWSRVQTNRTDRASLLLRLGEVHEHMGGDLSRAAEVYAQAAAEDRDNAACLRALGRSFEALRRWQSAAEAYLAQAEESDHQHERLVTLRRVAEMAQRELADPELAISSLQEIAKHAPDDLLSLYQLVALSRLHRRTAVLQDALQLLVERVTEGASKATALVELGEVLEHGLNRRNDAKDAYSRALKASPGYTPAIQALARIHREAGDFEAVLTLYDPVSDPVTDPAALALKAARVCYEELGDPGRAIMFAKQAYETNPDFAAARAFLLQLLRTEDRVAESYDLLRAQPSPATPALQADQAYQLGLFAEATARAATSTSARASAQAASLQHYRAALQQQPHHSLAWERARRILVAASDFDNLVTHLEQRIEVTAGGEQAALHVSRARVLALTSEGISEARSSYELALQQLQDDPVVTREYATLLRHVSDRDSLPSLYLNAAENIDDNGMSAAMLIEACESLQNAGQDEDTALAADAVVRALGRDPGNAFAVRHLERLLLESEKVTNVNDAVSVRAVRAQSDLERAIFYLESAELLEQSGDYALARRAYRASLTAAPKNFPAESGLGRTSERRDGPPPVRRPVSTQVVRASVHALLNQAKQRVSAAINSDDQAAPQQAVKLLREIFNRDGNHRDAFRLLERLISSINDPGAAVELLREFFWTLGDAELRHELGLILAEFGRDSDECIRALRAATDAKPDSKVALERLVREYRDIGDTDSAALVTEQLLNLFPVGDAAGFELRLGLARHLANNGDTLDRALHHGEQLLAQAPDNPRAISLMAEVLEQGGRPLDAEIYLRKLVEQQREPAEQRTLHLRRARLLARSKAHTSAAIDATRLAFNVDPGDREASQILIKLHERLGDMGGLSEFFHPARTALMRKFAIGDVSTRDLQILTHMAKAASRPLGYTIQGVLHAVDANFTAPPEEHFRPAVAEGLARTRQPPILTKILHRGESLELTRLLACLEPAMERLTEFFPKFDRGKTSPMPFNVKPAVLTPVLQQWCPSVGLAAPTVASTIASNVVTVLPGKQPIVQFGENLWMQGNEQDWRGLAAVALARHALGASQVRSLDRVELDLLLAAAFESVGVFNAITADPDPERLSSLTSLLNRSLPRKARKILEQCCHQLSNENFTPSETARRIAVGDLRVAYLVSGDVAGILGAACLMDGVSGPDLKARLQKSRLGQQLLIDLVSDPITQCRSIATGQTTPESG